MMIRSILAMTLLLTAVVTLPANSAEITVDVRFGDLEISVIRDYFEAGDRDGRKKRNNGRSLPPGIAKNLERGKSLPPGIAKQTLPADLASQLPPPPDGYERVIAGSKVLLVDIATQVIHDVLTDVIVN